MAVCTFGKPASNSLCKGVCGEAFSKDVYELNRLCRVDETDIPMSFFVSRCLKKLKIRNWIIISYSDTGMHHNGYIYQACNFLYTGATKKRTDIYSGPGKHSRHYTEEDKSNIRQVRTAKHRYVYFCTSDRKLKKQWLDSLRYKIYPYPKGTNQNYELGQYQVPILVQKNPETGKYIQIKDYGEIS